jgi:proteasome lid subunit RPN8/RPN11
LSKQSDDALRLNRHLLEAMIEHALRGRPEEVCGLLVGPPGAVVEVRAGTNVAKYKRTRFTMAPEELVAHFADLAARGWELAGIYHSHPCGPSHPSVVDVAQSFYPHALCVIISLAQPAKPNVRAFRLGQGVRPYSEVELIIS